MHSHSNATLVLACKVISQPDNSLSILRMTVRHDLPGNDTWERSVAACHNKESAEILHAIGDFGDIDRKPNETEYEP